MSATQRILITGAGGFTGRHLSALLSSDPATALILADRNNPPGSSDPRFRTCNFLNAGQVHDLIEDIHPDGVYHLVGSYTNRFEVDYASNVLSTKNILDAVLATSLGTRIFLVGSSAEYGYPLSKDKPVPETHPLRPVSVYGLIKLFQTELMGAYIRLYGLDIVSVRPFNLLGAGISPTLFAGKMEQEIDACKRGEIKEVLTGDLSVERDYIDIEKAVKYYSMVMRKGKSGEVYNVGSGKSVPLREILRRMLSKAGLSMDVVCEGRHETPGKIVIPKIFADVTKIEALI